jgi:hypothetical protein
MDCTMFEGRGALRRPVPKPRGTEPRAVGTPYQVRLSVVLRLNENVLSNYNLQMQRPSHVRTAKSSVSLDRVNHTDHQSLWRTLPHAHATLCAHTRRLGDTNTSLRIPLPYVPRATTETPLRFHRPLRKLSHPSSSQTASPNPKPNTQFTSRQHQQPRQSAFHL